MVRVASIALPVGMRSKKNDQNSLKCSNQRFRTEQKEKENKMPEGFFDAGTIAVNGVIADRSLRNDNAITRLWIPNNVRSIGTGAFKECLHLEEIRFEPGGVGRLDIGLMSFEGCSQLRGVTFPERLASIGDASFRNCTNLVAVSFSSTGQGINIGNRVFWGCTSLETLTLPSSSVAIGAACFCGCTALGTVSFSGEAGGNGIIYIGNIAFADCGHEAEIVAAIEAENTRRRNIAANQPTVTGPGQVIGILSGMGSISGHEITASIGGTNDHGACVQLRKYFCKTAGDTTSVHFEVEAKEGMVFVEIHSEIGSTPIIVHDFLHGQFRDILEYKGPIHEDGCCSFRFATRRIQCIGRPVNEVVNEVAHAVEALYATYEGYLDYLQRCYNENGNLANCMCFNAWNQQMA